MATFKSNPTNQPPGSSDAGNLWKVFDFPTTDLKTDLFTQIHYLRQLSAELENILLLPEDDRRAWLETNETMLSEYMAELSDQTMLAMEGMDGDETEVELTIEFVTCLRDVANMIHSILHGRRRIRN